MSASFSIGQPGARNSLTDVPGIRVGHAQDDTLKTGVTVVTGPDRLVASVNVMGGAPGTRETDLLMPDKVVESIDAVVLSGGSAMGLDAASGVTDALREQGKGYVVGPVTVPIVPAAIIFDLLAGGDHTVTVNPYRALGREALSQLATDCAIGSVGAGTGATTATLKGGLGMASLVLPNGCTVAALAVANPHGSVVSPEGRFYAAPLEIDAEFGGCGVDGSGSGLLLQPSEKLAAFNAKANTTIAIVATDAILDKAQCQRMATSAQDGMARAILPSHTPFDGDLVFGVSTVQRTLPDPVSETLLLGHAAAICLSRAIARGVYAATAVEGDILPTWQERFG